MDLNSYIPESLQASFFVEKNREGGLLCTCRFTYGQKDFNPLNRFEERQLPLEMYRDMGRETIILEVLQSWFPFQNENMQCLMPEGDDTIFEFLLHGIGELSEFGEVYLEGALKTMHILPGPPLQMGISLEGNLLQIHVDMGESTQEELLELVKSYREKKRFYKCRNGTFIRLDQEEAGVLGELIQGLHLKDKDFQKNVLSVPGNRALFLDRLVKNSGMPVVRNQAYRSLLRDFKTYEDNDYELPIQLEAEMRGYQIQGFRWLKTLRQYGFGGILADEMGLGKTLQVIAFLLSEKENQKEKYRPALVVCPASLVYNWFNEFHKFAPAMSCLMLVGDQIARRSAMASAQGADIWITSYDLLRRDLPYYREFDFSIQVVDEAQFIKNKNTQNARAVKTVNAAMRIALTGTPIENRLSELWSIFDYLMPGYLFSYKYFREQIELPIVREQNEGAIARLHKMIGPFVLRRLKTQVLSELPDKMEEIVYSRLEGEQHKLYNGVALLLKKQLEGTDDKDFSSQKLQILAQLMRLRQICCDPSLCFEGYTGESAKRIACLQLVRNAVEGGHKILVFSQFTSMLALLESSFTQEGITSYTLTGNTPKDRRMQLVQAFQKDETPVFLISLKAGGTGLNLTAADIVIHYDPWWNSSVQNQATDRTHRIGQEKVVSVFKLITENTIEEKIRQLQEKKHQLAEDVLAGEQVSLSTLTRQDLLEILA